MFWASMKVPLPEAKTSPESSYAVTLAFCLVLAMSLESF
jgi:hypothetical protein